MDIGIPNVQSIHKYE